jgi:thioredoxin reductase (NADPH)
VKDAREFEVAIVGAGPIGLETAAELKRRGVNYVHFDRGQIGSTISWFPEGMTFFSSTDRIAIAGIPIQTTRQEKCTKEEYLAYLRAVALALELEVRAHEEVLTVTPRESGGFRLVTRRAGAERRWQAARVVFAVGDTHAPRRLGIPGEDLPHVSHYFESPHAYFRQDLLVVGGRNSAVEAALRCWHTGARVTLSYRRDEFDRDRVKYWLLPELLGRIERGEIACRYGTEPVEITPGETVLRRSDGETFAVRSDFVLLLTGYVADLGLLARAGVRLGAEDGAPVFDERTMETNVPGLFVAGTTTAGTQETYRVFIENCHVHARRIAAAVCGETPPPPPVTLSTPES